MSCHCGWFVLSLWVVQLMSCPCARVWKYLKGRALACHPVRPDLPPLSAPAGEPKEDGPAVVKVTKKAMLWILNIFPDPQVRNLELRIQIQIQEAN
jgi:hypothetical protein